MNLYEQIHTHKRVYVFYIHNINMRYITINVYISNNMKEHIYCICSQRVVGEIVIFRQNLKSYILEKVIYSAGYYSVFILDTQLISGLY